MNLEQAVFFILLEAGEKGLSVAKIALHVHNLTNTFFENGTFEEVYRQVRYFVRKNSRNSYSFLEHTEVRGHYRLNKKSEKFLQQKLF